MKKIGVLGAGTWGITLARLLCNKGYNVCVWSAIPAEIDELSTTRVHKNLPQMKLPDALEFTKDIKDACVDKDLILFAVPSVFVRSTSKAANAYIKDNQLVVSVAKGLEPVTLLTMTQAMEEELDSKAKIVALSGPTHAEEVAVDLPTMIVSACEDESAAKQVQEIFSTPCLRVYTNNDILGVELCGAIKNVMALAAGISAGLGYGDNAKAALITRGITEMIRLGIAMGCDYKTFSGLAGIGDLVVTATSVHSRNNRAGYLIGQGATAKEATEKVGMVVEGLNALPGAMAFAKRYNVNMPLVFAVNAIVNENADPKAVVNDLMSREYKPEFSE